MTITQIMFRPKDGFATRYVRVGVIKDSGEYWNWCVENVNTNTWMKMTGLTGVHAGYYFENDEDATAFILKFGI